MTNLKSNTNACMHYKTNFIASIFCSILHLFYNLPLVGGGGESETTKIIYGMEEFRT